VTKGTKIVVFILLPIALLIGGGIYFVHYFFSSFAPAEITITKTEISSNRGFINPITIEKLKVDSFGIERRPVKYTIQYFTTCSIKQKDGKPPISLDEIKLNESGRYLWDEEKVNISILHEDGYSKRFDSTQRFLWSMGERSLDICPLKFENDNWYFINFLDPQIIGIYIYIDKKGNLRKYPTYSGVSPI
jgi:hypothetical protein